MEDLMLFEQFHDALDIEPRAGSFERLRSKLVANEPGGRARRSTRVWLPDGWLRIAAVAALIVLAAAWVVAFLAINANVHRSVPALPGPYKVRAPGVPVCATSCRISDVTFVSPSVGFVLEESGPDLCDVSCKPQTASLFRTDDGGDNWTPVYSTVLDCCGSGRFIASADGKQLLVIGTKNGGTVLASNEAGSGRWSGGRLPSRNASVKQTICPPAYKPSPCTQQSLDPLVYFTDPRHGWAVSQEQTFNIADLYETTNGGADWALVGRIDVLAQFGLDLGAGRVVDHALRGHFLFTGDRLAWFIPAGAAMPPAPPGPLGPMTVFRSTDGGITWTRMTIAAPPGTSSIESASASLKFFDSRDGVLELVVNPTSDTGLMEERFVYTTSDAGTTWSTAFPVPEPGLYESMRFIDPQHWVGWPYGGGFISTSDAGKHWNVVAAKVEWEQPPVEGGGLPPQLPADYPPHGQYGFIDAVHGWALPFQGPSSGNGAGVALFVTSDGGVNWRPVSLPEML